MVFITKVEVESNHLLFSFHLENTVTPTYCFTHMVIYFNRWLGELIYPLQILKFELDNLFRVIAYISHPPFRFSFLCPIFQKQKLRSKLARKCFLMNSYLFLAFILPCTAKGLSQCIFPERHICNHEKSFRF